MISGNEARLVAPVVDAFDLAVLFGSPTIRDSLHYTEQTPVDCSRGR
jgi:hypothetical protein